MPVAIPLVAIGVALLVLLIAYVLVIVFTPVIEGILREIPFVGGVLAGKAKAALEWAGGKIVSYANAGVATVEHWFTALADVERDFVDAINAFIVSLPDKLDHLVHVTVHEIVKAFVNPVRDTAEAAASDAAAALVAAAGVVDLPLADFKGIEHGVDARIGALRDLVENVDLPDLQRTLDREISRAADAVAGDVHDLADFTDKEFGRLWDGLGKIPLQQLVEGLAASTALGVLVHTIASEAGLDNAECRSKFKQVCATNPAAWTDLLALAGVAFVWPGFRTMADVARDLLRELEPAVTDVLGGG